MNRPLLSPLKQPILHLSVSPCDPSTLHRSWHQHLTCRARAPVYFRRPHSLTDFSDLADDEEVSRNIAIHANASYGPTRLTTENMREMLSLRDNHKLMFLRYLGRKELTLTAKQFKKSHQPTTVSFANPPGQLVNKSTGQPIYGIHNNNLVYNYKVAKFQNVLLSSFFGAKLVIDFSYDHLMRPKEQRSLARQVKSISTDNLKQNEPFDLIFTNFSDNQFFLKHFASASDGLHPAECFIDVHRAPVFELFPRDKLVYLSPDSENQLRCFDDDKVYVIGALVDTFHTSNRASYDYCLKNDIPSARLPLDSLPIAVFSSRFTLMVVANILHSMKHGNDVISSTLQHMATRKTRNILAHQVRQEKRRSKFKMSDPLEDLFRTHKRHPASREDIIKCRQLVHS